MKEERFLSVFMKMQNVVRARRLTNKIVCGVAVVQCAHKNMQTKCEKLKTVVKL